MTPNDTHTYRLNTYSNSTLASFFPLSQENDKIEAIRYDGESSCFPELVSNMKKLRLLYVPANGFVHFRSQAFQGPSFLSNELRYIYWNGYPPSSFPKGFQPTKLVVLRLERSLQTELWKGFKVIQLFLLLTYKSRGYMYTHNLIVVAQYLKYELFL